MDALDFVVHEPARLLRAGHAAAIGLCVPDVSNPFWGEVTRRVGAAATEHGAALIVCSTDESAAKEVDMLRVLEQQRVAGILVAALEPDLEALDRLVDRGTPVALLNRHDGRGRLPFATVDDVEGGRLVGQYLLSLGHRRIAVVNGPVEISWCADRWRGVCLAVEEAGLEPDQVLHQVPVDAQKASEGERVASLVLTRSADVTAVFCVNDLLALGILRGLIELGVNVPRDISLRRARAVGGTGWRGADVVDRAHRCRDFTYRDGPATLERALMIVQPKPAARVPHCGPSGVRVHMPARLGGVRDGPGR